MTKKSQRELNARRIRAIGGGFDEEEAIVLEALNLPGITRVDRAQWLTRLVSVYIRYDQFEKAGATAYELAKLPLKIRYAYDYVVVRNLVLMAGQYKAAIDYIDASLSNESELREVFRLMGDGDMVALRSLAQFELSTPESVEGRKSIQELVFFYSWSPRLEPFMKVLRESEDALLSTPRADEALGSVWASLKLMVKNGNKTRREDLKCVEAAMRRLAKLKRLADE